MKTLEFRIRKLHVNSDTEKRLQKRQPSRVYVNEEALIELTGSKDGGKLVYVEKASQASADGPPMGREATLWKAPEKLDKAVTQMYDSFRDACGYRLGEHVKITATGGPILDADEVILEEVTTEEASQGQETPASTEPLPEGDIPGWEFHLAGKLSQLEHVHAGLIFKNLFVRGPQRTFVVASVNGRSNGNARYVDRKTTVKVARPSDAANKADGSAESQKMEITGIRGMDAQITKLNDLLSTFVIHEKHSTGLPNPSIVLTGGHGTGKTMLLDKLAAISCRTVFRIQFKDKLSEIQETFQRAKLQQPSIILIDQFERLIHKDRNNRDAVILAICDALDNLASEAKLKGVAPKVAVIVACLDYTTDIPEELKEPKRLTNEIYLPLPDVAGRKEILTSLNLNVDPAEEPALLDQLSERTHAYNGKDLECLVIHAKELSYIRASKLPPSPPPPPAEDPPSSTETHSLPFDFNTLTLNPPTSPSPPHIPPTTPSDYLTALKTIRPSAMHDINLRPPPIHWSDIGGQHAVKKSLQRAVRLATESPIILSRFFDRPPKGFLLYGPPGCSKTMAAQAMATESGLNFFAVKGAELLNMYVGESERAVRALFQRAREVAPSMIFFDEIDSIGGQRHGFGHGGAAKGGTTSGLNVLTTLLNEMDGFEALQGVVVLAATNRPQALDPALLRPGRFDELIYVSPPDEEARKAIFRGVATKRRMHSDVDVEALARETEGFSGAEIKGICAVAGVEAYDRYDSKEGRVEGEGEEEEEEGVCIVMEDLRRAIGGQKRQITGEMIRGFEEWERQFRR
ncbi:P-loop containing nucleoside triphosphate hydrolase protein [Cercophora newfieldiana]|uniref:P-loop containing nucleoside triphosphate hydrolase protein n=1 Tax=Cercophora newfieldiana TaxID=92897 RepID=A0AA39Y073_9PEZI|nr:P-loop containing nucleoside triphosphate hydrolase protein [Cercophora newfieldiana]